LLYPQFPGPCGLSSCSPEPHIHVQAPGCGSLDGPHLASSRTLSGGTNASICLMVPGCGTFFAARHWGRNVVLVQREGLLMSTAQAVTQHLPFLRRYARALTG